MPEVAVADVAHDLGADHAMTLVDFFFDIGRVKWLKIARPAASGVKFGVRGEERCATTDAAIDPELGMIPVTAGKGAFCAFLTGNVVFLWG